MNRILTLLISLLCLASALSGRERLTEIPTVYIDTDNSAAITGKSEYVPGSITVVSNDENECCTEVRMGIRGRGNSTWNMAKKPYRVKFDAKTNFMNLPAKAKSWVFLANYADKTLMRNAIAFEISSFVGMEYTPSVKFVDVVLNGKYIGNYMVTDQTEVAKNRVPVETQELTDTEEPAVTGGYLIELDGFADSEPVWFQTEQGIKVTVKYPKDDEINPQQLAYITDYVREFEKRLFAADFTDPEKGYRSMVDEESLVNWYIACELTANSDSFWSTYIYKKREDNRLYFGPLWDFDIAFNNDNRLGNAVNQLMRERAHEPRTWIRRMWKDEWFRTAVNTRWTQLNEQGLENHLLNKIEEYATLIDASQQLNFTTWPVLSDRVYLENALFPTYRGGVDYLKEFVSARIEFLTESFANTDPELWAVEVNPESRYLLRHSAGSWMAEQSATCKLAAEADASEIRFVPSGNEPGAYGIELPSGKFMGSDNQWNIKLFNACTDPYALFTLEKTEDGSYVRIKNMGRDRYLGVDSTEPGGGIYTDKAADYDRNRWVLREIKEETGVQTVECVAAPHLCGDVLECGSDACAVSIYGTDGRLLLSVRAASVDLSDLVPGLYIAAVTDVSGETVRLKFIKSN